MNNLGRISLFLIVLSVCLIFDKQIAFEVSEDEHSILRAAAGSITDIARGKYWVASSCIIILVTSLMLRLRSGLRLQKIENLRRWAAHLMLSIISCGAIVFAIKIIVGRERPDWSDGFHSFGFSPGSFEMLNQSFPSGHTQVIFCVATMCSFAWPRHRWIFMAVALLLATTRVLTLAHFASDVLVGMLIGTYGTKASIRFWSKWIYFPPDLSFNESNSVLTGQKG